MQNTGTLKVTNVGDRETVIVREFDAPKHLVFDALTNAEHLKRWYGPHGWSLIICDVDLRVGGKYRFVLRGPEGYEMSISGEYRELQRPDRIVYTERVDDYPSESIVTTTCVEHNGKTTFTSTVLAASKEFRDVILSADWEHGAAESYDRLADLLAAEAVAATPGN